VILKYKNKLYSSADLPIFLYFRNEKNKKEFLNILTNYTKPDIFVKLTCFDIALAGNTVIKDKRSTLYINMETMDEKRHVQRYVYDSEETSNAVISTPPDIKPRILEEWIERLTKDINMS
jgi:hypothetical protein